MIRVLSIAAIFTIVFGNVSFAAEEAKDIVSAEPNADGLVAKLRPVVPNISTGDRIRFALHFAKKDGPIEHADKIGQRLLDRSASFETFEFAVKTNDGQWQRLTFAELEKPLQQRQSMLYSNPTFILEIGEKSLISMNMHGIEEMSRPLEGARMVSPGKLQIAIRGKLLLKEGRPGPDNKANPVPMPFQVGPIQMKVTRAGDMHPSLAELAKLAENAVAKLPEIAAEKLKVMPNGKELLTIADEKGNRVVRVRVNMPPPPAGAPIIAGGFGYWRYEVLMTPAGQVVSTARQRTGFCVARGTLVETPSGPRPIEQIQQGDFVWGYDLARGEPVVAKVTATVASTANETFRIGDLRVTDDHPVYADGKWKNAANLTEKDRLLDKDLQWRAAGAIRVVAEKVDVFDLTVDGTHNFFAGGVLVHNKSIAWSPQHHVPWYALWNRVPPPKKP